MKNILVHLDGGTRSPDRLQLAVALAKTHDSRLYGIFGQRAAPHRVGVIATWPSESYRQAAEASQAAFAQAVAGLRASHWQDANRGSDSALGEVIGDAARYFDLTILGLGDEAAVTPDIAAATLARSGRPALVLPIAGRFDAIGNNPLLVWDDSPAAARAFGASLPLLNPRTPPTVLILTDGSIDTDKPQAVHDYLLSHGIAARTEHVIVGSSAPADLILNRAADQGVDLIVAGWSTAHGPALLRHLTVPVLLAG